MNPRAAGFSPLSTGERGRGEGATLAAGPANTSHPRAVAFNCAVPIGTTVIVREPGRQPVSARTINWATGRPDGRVVVDLDGFYRSTPVEWIDRPKPVEVSHAA